MNCGTCVSDSTWNLIFELEGARSRRRWLPHSIAQNAIEWGTLADYLGHPPRIYLRHLYGPPAQRCYGAGLGEVV
jgi:hypothetical protein